MRVLLVEDEKKLSNALKKILEKNNFSVDDVYDGAEALDYLEYTKYDAVVMDIMMPVMDGISALKTMRARGDMTPVILLTAKGEVEDKVEGLDAGANDYLPKPFDSRELLARIRAMTRSKNEADIFISMGNVKLNRATFEVSTPTKGFKLAHKEFQMMEMFMMNPHVIISTETFMEKIWGFDTDTELNVVWVYISFLRKKLVAMQANVEIKTSRNAGYYIQEIQ